MEEKNKSVKNVKVNQENVKKNFQYKLKRAFAIVGTVIVVGSVIGGIDSSRKKDKENVNSYLSGISVSESISEYEQLKQIKIEDIKDWLEISEDSIKYEDEVVKILKDNTDYKPELHIDNSLDEYKKAAEIIENLYGKDLSPEQEDLLIKAALTLSKNAQLANEKLRKYGYNFVEKETLRLLKEDFAKHVGIEFDDPDKIEIGIVEDEWTTPCISVNVNGNENGNENGNGNIYECTGYPCDVAKIIGAAQSARRGVSKESDMYEYNEDRNDVLRNAVKACEVISSGATDEVIWDIKVPKKNNSKYYNPIKCKAPSLNEIIKSSKEANLTTEGRSR